MFLNLPEFLFYVFSISMLASASMVIFSKNSVHASLFLMLTFFNSTFLFILLGAEFLAMIILMVYIGAVVILFLFVVMTIDNDILEFKKNKLQFFSGILITLIFLLELIAIIFWSNFSSKLSSNITRIPINNKITNIEQIGNILYTDYVFYFELSGLILFISMVGAIVLTLHPVKKRKKQEISKQVNRTIDSSIELKKDL